jgi:hypothetical protein
MTNGANYETGKLHHSPWHSDICTSNQLNNQNANRLQHVINQLLPAFIPKSDGDTVPAPS